MSFNPIQETCPPMTFVRLVDGFHEKYDWTGHLFDFFNDGDSISEKEKELLARKITAYRWEFRKIWESGVFPPVCEIFKTGNGDSTVNAEAIYNILLRYAGFLKSFGYELDGDLKEALETIAACTNKIDHPFCGYSTCDWNGARKDFIINCVKEKPTVYSRVHKIEMVTAEHAGGYVYDINDADEILGLVRKGLYSVFEEMYVRLKVKKKTRGINLSCFSVKLTDDDKGFIGAVAIICMIGLWFFSLNPVCGATFLELGLFFALIAKLIAKFFQWLEKVLTRKEEGVLFNSAFKTSVLWHVNGFGAGDRRACYEYVQRVFGILNITRINENREKILKITRNIKYRSGRNHVVFQDPVKPVEKPWTYTCDEHELYNSLKK